jgi:hypothetical protein
MTLYDFIPFAPTPINEQSIGLRRKNNSHCSRDGKLFEVFSASVYKMMLLWFPIQETGSL